MSEQVVDTVIAHRVGSGAVPRAQVEETIDSSGRATSKLRSDVQQEQVAEGGAGRKPLRASTQALLDKIPVAAHEMGDEGPGGDEDGIEQDAVDADGNAIGEETTEETTEEEAAPVENEWQTKYTKMEETNRSLVRELDAAKKTPRNERTQREKDLIAAEQSYVEEGPLSAVRRLVATVLGKAVDSKEVAEEMSGLYSELTAHELGVPLELSQRAIRDNARTRLAVERDKREKVEATPKETASADTIPPEATQFIQNRLTMKRESGRSLADDHPMLMTLATHLDRVSPEELVARVLQREYKAGTLDASMGEDAMVQAAAKMIENAYSALYDTLAKAKPSPKPTGTTKPEAVQPASTSQKARQGQAAPKLTNANASAAPGAPPVKKTAQPAETTERPKFKSAKEAKDWALRHLENG